MKPNNEDSASRVPDESKIPIPKYYSAYVDCTNCGRHDRIAISCGTKVTDVNCPNCGCKTLERQK